MSSTEDAAPGSGSSVWPDAFLDLSLSDDERRKVRLVRLPNHLKSVQRQARGHTLFSCTFLYCTLTQTCELLRDCELCLLRECVLCLFRECVLCLMRECVLCVC